MSMQPQLQSPVWQIKGGLPFTFIMKEIGSLNETVENKRLSSLYQELVEQNQKQFVTPHTIGLLYILGLHIYAGPPITP